MSAFSHKLDQVTYPRMERQDLTQGQLGSFKFTPTDEVRHMFSKSSPGLAQPFVYHGDKVIRNGKAPKLSINVPSNVSSTLNTVEPTKSPSRFDASVFDTCFKPDLTKSRLLLGSPALRAAVDGTSVSPLRQSVHAPPFRPKIDTSTQNNTQPHFPVRQDIMSTIPTVSPNNTPSSMSFVETSLVRALASEQQAHQITKDALEIEKARRIEAETENRKHIKNNRSLIGSVNMLKSVIQHNMKREQEAEKNELERVTGRAEDSERPPTLLHDAVKNLKSPLPKHVQPHLADENELFNFDLVDIHGSAVLQRHFSTSQATPEEANFPSEPEEPEKDSQSISKTPRNIKREGSSEETWDSYEMVVDPNTDEPTVERVLVQRNGSLEADPDPVFVKPERYMAMPFDAHVQWSQESIFDGQADKFRRIRDHSSTFSKHPVRYIPNKSDKNLYRTIMIDFIPIGTKYKQVLDQIAGGAVESIQLVGPVGQSTKFMTARIVFNYELGARGVYMRGQNPGIEINGKRVRVWQVLEATYPRNATLEHEIFDNGYTRILLIENAVEASLEKLPQKLAHQIDAGFVIEIGKTHDDIPMIEFISVAECSKALTQLMSDRDFRGSRFDFEDDPCDDPYPSI